VMRGERGFDADLTEISKEFMKVPGRAPRGASTGEGKTGKELCRLPCAEGKGSIELSAYASGLFVITLNCWFSVKS
jgi:hypothetical protein